MKVSVLIPCFNSAQFLPECLDSVVAQTHRDLQIVVVDDGSSDDTMEIAQRYASRDGRIEVYRQENTGVASARNNLLSHLKGDCFLFVDSDDWIERDMVEFLVEEVERNGADIAVCDSATDGKVKETRRVEEIWNREDTVREFLRHQRINGALWNKLISSSSVGGALFDCSISYGEDALFLWDVLQNVDKVVLTDRQLYHYRMNEGSISHQVFGSRKLGAHRVWEHICEDVVALWPQYVGIARARWAVEDIQLVRAAARSGYPYDDTIRDLQQTVRCFWPDILRTHLSTVRMRLYSFVASRCYRFAGIF